MTVMPMFPLGSVLLPGSVLPLHVFEPRYLQMMDDCLQHHDQEFGVVLIERGSEVGGGDRRTMHGTVAKMVQVGQVGGGRLLVVCVGTRRIRVNAWLRDDPYPLADVDDWPDAVLGPDTTGDIARLVAEVAPRVRRAHALAVELGDRGGELTFEWSDDTLEASYQLAAVLPVGPTDQHALLAASSPLDRLQSIRQLLGDVELLQQFRLADGALSGPEDPGDEWTDDDI